MIVVLVLLVILLAFPAQAGNKPSPCQGARIAQHYWTFHRKAFRQIQRKHPHLMRHLKTRCPQARQVPAVAPPPPVHQNPPPPPAVPLPQPPPVDPGPSSSLFSGKGAWVGGGPVPAGRSQLLGERLHDPAFLTAYAQKLVAHGVKWLGIPVQNQGLENTAFTTALRSGRLSPFTSRGLRIVGMAGIGDQPARDATVSAQIINANPLAGFVADAEQQYKDDTGGSKARSGIYVRELITRVRRDVELGLTTYGAATKPWLLSSVYDYGPWIREGFHLLPQAYLNESSTYDPRWVEEHSVAVGFPLERVHLMFGFYPWKPRVPMSTYMQAYAGHRSTGYSVWLSEFLTAEDWAVSQ